jgi:hypothetical protein
MVVALVALSSSLASGAMAAKLLTGKDIANKSITGKDLKGSTVTGKHVKNRSLGAKEFKKGHLPLGEIGPVGPRGPEGPEGPAGPRGPAGADGTDGVDGADGADGVDGTEGAPGATTVVIRHGADTNIQASTIVTATAECNAGERATGGGGTSGNATGVHLKHSAPTPSAQGETPSGWSATYENTSGSPAVIRAWVVCAAP